MVKITAVLMVFALTACAPQKLEPRIRGQQVQLKQSLSGLAPCMMEHRECGGNEYCVEAPAYLTGSRQCMRQNQVGEFFGCRSGELIIMPDEPWRLDCLDDEGESA
jgi:hypothetical protein